MLNASSRAPREAGRGGKQGMLYSLQTRLIVALVGVVVVALLLAGGVLVYVQRGEAAEQALDRATAASARLLANYAALKEQGVVDAAEFVRTQTEVSGAQLLSVGPEGQILRVSDGVAGTAGGQVFITRVESAEARTLAPGQVVQSAGGGNLVVAGVLDVTESANAGPTMHIGPPAGTDAGVPGDVAERVDQLLVAVPESSITGAWVGLLPELGAAAAIALPVAVLLAVLLARYITRPLQELTLATQQISAGRFEVEVPSERRDEIGRLARSVESMASRVGETTAQMRGLMADVSHDLRTPLTSVLGFSKALRDGITDGEASRRAGVVIFEEASRLEQRLGELLYASQLESGQVVLECAPTDVSALVAATVERAGPLGAERALTLTTSIEDGVTASADAARLERAVENLVSNAVKFAPAGSAVRISLRHVTDSAVIEVANRVDDGLEVDDLPRLFERFYRHDRVRGVSGPGGSGLGLPIARDIVELHGGNLDASLDAGEVKFVLQLSAQAG